MKKMTCKDLGGACDEVFGAASFKEMAQLSKQHGMEMLKANDAAHVRAMEAMQTLMSEPGTMESWFEEKKNTFKALPES